MKSLYCLLCSYLSCKHLCCNLIFNLPVFFLALSISESNFLFRKLIKNSHHSKFRPWTRNQQRQGDESLRRSSDQTVKCYGNSRLRLALLTYPTKCLWKFDPRLVLARLLICKYKRMPNNYNKVSYSLNSLTFYHGVYFQGPALFWRLLGHLSPLDPD